MPGGHLLELYSGEEKMIFITVGSQKFQFNRLLQAVDKLVENGKIKEEVFAQRGVCNYIPKNYRSKEFLDREEFASIIRSSDLVITHGGTGAIVGAVKAGKKVIAVARLAQYKEHVDNHQLQLISEFTKSGFILGCDELDELEMLINEARSKEFAVYHSNTRRYIDAMERYFESI